MALVNCAASLTPNFSPRSCSRYASQAVAMTFDSVQPFCLAICSMAVLMWRGTRPVTCSVCLVSEPWRDGRSTAFVIFAAAVALPCLFPSAGGMRLQAVRASRTTAPAVVYLALPPGGLLPVSVLLLKQQFPEPPEPQSLSRFLVWSFVNLHAIIRLKTH